MVPRLRLADISQVGNTAYARLAMWEKTYGSAIDLEWRGVLFPVKLYKYNGEMRLMFREAKQYTQYVPVAIEICPHDPTTLHIHNIHRTAAISGTQLVNFALTIGRKLGATEALLQDAATVVCKTNQERLNLSLITLIRTGKSFYERFGFEAYPKTRRKRVAARIKRFQAVTLADVLKRFRQAIRLLERARKDPATFELRIKGDDGYPDIYVRDPAKRIPAKLTLYKRIADKMSQSASRTLAEFLANSARHAGGCTGYTDFYKLAFDEETLVYRGRPLVVNSWARTLQQIDCEYPDQLRYTF